MRRQAWLRSIVAAALILGAMSVAAADPPVDAPQFRRIRDLRRRVLEARRPAFAFTPPEGYATVATLGADMPEGPPPTYMASPGTPGIGYMLARVGPGAITIDEALLVDQLKKTTDSYKLLHPTGSVKLVKKELVKLDAGPAARLLVETRVDAKRATKPVRELHYLLTGASHRAHVVYTAPAASYPKLEKSYDASIRKTTVLDSPKLTAEAPIPGAPAQPSAHDQPAAP